MVPFSRIWGNCQRMFFLGDYLADHGDSVDIICSHNGNYSNAYDSRAEQIHVNAFNLKGQSVQEINKDEIAAVKSISTKNSLKIRIGDLLSRMINLFYNESNYRNSLKVLIWSITNAKNIKKILLTKKYDCVIISCPPHTLFRVSKIVAKFNVKLIFDYRDPWNLWRSNYPISTIVERNLLKRADYVVFTNKNILDDMVIKYKLNRTNLEVVANGYSEKKWKKFRDSYVDYSCNKSQFVISYIGGIGINNRVNYRDCTNLLKAYDKFSVDKKCLLKIIGVTDLIENDIERFRNKRIELQGQVSEEQSFQEMILSDILLVLHTSNDGSGHYIVSAKIYDYIASGTYILAIGENGSLHQEIVEREKLGSFVNNNVDDILNALESLYLKWQKSDLQVENNDHSMFSRESQYKKYDRLV